ncbi:hypothetical protein HC928_02555 [bacterium]|nr:hypothetical protein [bacterium]
MSFITGTEEALQINSISSTFLSNVTIESQAPGFAIDGTIGGTLVLGSITFLANSSISPNLDTSGGAFAQQTVLNSYIRGGQISNYTDVNATPWSVLSTDYYLSVDTSSSSKTVILPNPSVRGRAFIVKDNSGNASVNNITVTTVGGTALIDGSITYLIDQNYFGFAFIDNGTNYEVN